MFSHQAVILIHSSVVYELYDTEPPKLSIGFLPLGRNRGINNPVFELKTEISDGDIIQCPDEHRL